MVCRHSVWSTPAAMAATESKSRSLPIHIGTRYCRQVHFVAQQGALSGYQLYVLLAPHLGNRGAGNTAWVDEFEGTPLLFAQREGNALALACSAPWVKRSVGYVGSSDGWQDLKAHKQMTWEYTRAENGNVAMTAEIDLSKSQGEFVLALGFGKDPEEAARNAISSLHEGFEKAKALITSLAGRNG